MTFNAQSRTHVTITNVVNNRESQVPSIRQICLQGLVAGRTTKEIAAEIERYHPDSAAAAKSSKHIAYYRCQLKAEGKLPGQQVTTEPSEQIELI